MGAFYTAGALQVSEFRIVYVAGYGRSGSTLLDVLLDNNPGVFGAGEIRRLWPELESDGTCTCGKRYSRCEFWCRVVDRLSRHGVLTQRDVPERSQESWSDEGASMAEYCHRWRTAFEAIAAEAHARVIVDSSKTSRRAFRRLPHLRACGFEVITLHLVRDPRGVMWSVRKGSNRLLEQKEPAKLPGGMLRGLIGWTISNYLVERMLRGSKGTTLRVRYEDLVCDPETQLRRIGAAARFDPSAAIEKLRTGAELLPGHAIGGNRMRRRGPIRVSADEEWRRGLPLPGKLAALACWPLARRYGYRFGPDLL